MIPSKSRGALLRQRQVLALSESLRYDLDQHPTWPDLWNLRGLLAAYEGDFEKARGAFELALEQNPGYSSARWNARWLELLVERPDRTEEEIPVDVAGAIQPAELLPLVRNFLHGIAPAADRTPDDPRLGFAALVIAARADAASSFPIAWEAATHREPALPELLESAQLWNDGPDVYALAELGRPDRINPGFADLLDRAGRFEAVSGNDGEAVRLFALSALLRGNRAVLLVEQAEIQARRGDGDRALEMLREAVTASPDWHRGHQALGYELSVRGRGTEALPHLEAAARLAPQYADVQYQYALLLHSTERHGEAIEALKTALKLNPRYLVARVALANLLFETGREKEAAPHLEQVLEEGFRTPLLSGRFGYAVHAAGHRTQAEEVFLKAITYDKDRAEILCLYGLFLAETDRTVEARAVWERALSTDPPEDIRRRLEGLLSGASSGGGNSHR